MTSVIIAADEVEESEEVRVEIYDSHIMRACIFVHQMDTMADGKEIEQTLMLTFPQMKTLHELIGKTMAGEFK